jgi:hypothetical protein
MKKLLLAVLILLFAHMEANAFDVYSSSSPTPAAASGVLCGVGTISYLYSVCESSPVAGTFAVIYASTAVNASVQNTGSISGAAFGCIPYQANYGSNGLFYTKSTSGQFTFTYGCN